MFPEVSAAEGVLRVTGTTELPLLVEDDEGSSQDCFNWEGDPLYLLQYHGAPGVSSRFGYSLESKIATLILTKRFINRKKYEVCMHRTQTITFSHWLSPSVPFSGFSSMHSGPNPISCRWCRSDEIEKRRACLPLLSHLVQMILPLKPPEDLWESGVVFSVAPCPSEHPASPEPCGHLDWLEMWNGKMPEQLLIRELLDPHSHDWSCTCGTHQAGIVPRQRTGLVNSLFHPRLCTNSTPQKWSWPCCAPPIPRVPWQQAWKHEHRIWPQHCFGREKKRL